MLAVVVGILRLREIFRGVRMTEIDRLVTINAKIGRAEKHLKDLEAEVQSFFKSQPYQVDVRRDSRSQKLVYYLASVRNMPPDIPVITGDVLHSLKNALDHLAYQLAHIGTNGKGPFKHIYFPIADDDKKYKNQRMGQLRGLRPDAIKAIDAIKPYKGSNDLLWQLHKLNIIDKHRQLVTVGSAYGSVNIGPGLSRKMKKTWEESGFEGAEMIPSLDLFLRPADNLFPLKTGDELYISEPDAEVDPQMQFKFVIVFGESIAEGEPLLQLLHQMIKMVNDIVLSLKPLLI